MYDMDWKGPLLLWIGGTLIIIGMTVEKWWPLVFK